MMLLCADAATIMDAAGPILFFSDAHFGAHGEAQERLKVERFVSFLSQARTIGAEVFFLGDLFDFWFEYRHWIPKTAIGVTAAIHAFTAAGGAFHIILGNHDIWAGDYFTTHLGAEVHRDPVVLVRQGLRLHISHGDGEAPSDRGYRFLRRILRWPVNIRLFRLWPADWAYRTAHYFSGRSRDLTARRSADFLVEYDRVAAQILSTGFDAVIMGHLHHGWVRALENGWWVNSGEFYEAFTYVTLKEGRFRIEHWCP
ncbi:MAG: UDP-2,3-diacylglucosamine diphosphatase [Candidatus Zixiibacteriota bacterium]